MKKFSVGLMAFIAMGLAQASVPIFQPKDGEGAGWAHIHNQLVGAEAIKDGRIEVPVLGAYAFQILKETKRVNELHPDHRSEKAAITLMEGILGGKEIATEDFQKRLLAGGLDFPDAAETERLRTATALAEIEKLQKTLASELTKLSGKESEAASKQRAEISKLQKEIASLERDLKAQAASVAFAQSALEKRVEGKTAKHAKSLEETLTATQNTLEKRVQAAVGQTAGITGRLDTIEAAPILKYGNTVLWLLGAALLGLLGLGAASLWLKRETGTAKRLAHEAQTMPEEALSKAWEAHTVATQAVGEIEAIKKEVKEIRAKQRDIDIPGDLKDQLRKLTADEPSYHGSIVVDEVTFDLGFVYHDGDKVFIRGIKDQENAVGIDGILAVLRRAGRDGRVVGWEAMQKREPSLVRTTPRGPILKPVPGAISRTTEKLRERESQTGPMPDIRTD